MITQIATAEPGHYEIENGDREWLPIGDRAVMQLLAYFVNPDEACKTLKRGYYMYTGPMRYRFVRDEPA
jgi:hypothetical protein